jgi:hypothetical protein
MLAWCVSVCGRNSDVFKCAQNCGFGQVNIKEIAQEIRGFTEYPNCVVDHRIVEIITFSTVHARI